MNIYVGNLSYNAKEDEIKQAFEAYGQVKLVSVIMDKQTGASRGFGFVEMDSSTEAQAAIDGLNNQDFQGRKLIVNEARPKTERSPGDRRDRGGERGGDRGGFGGRR